MPVRANSRVIVPNLDALQLPNVGQREVEHVYSAALEVVLRVVEGHRAAVGVLAVPVCVCVCVFSVLHLKPFFVCMYVCDTVTQLVNPLPDLSPSPHITHVDTSYSQGPQQLHGDIGIRARKLDVAGVNRDLVLRLG